MIPKYNNSKTNINSNKQSQDNKKILTSLRGLRNVTFEYGNLLYENETQWHYIGFAFIIGGTINFFYGEMNVFLRILLGIALIIIGFFCFKLIESFSIINTTMNTIYKELRFNTYTIYKSKSVNIKDIVAWGIDHKRMSPKPDIPDPKEYGPLSFIFNFITTFLVGYIFFKTQEKKDSSMVDGLVEGSAIAYLTNDGKIDYFNPFSDKVYAEKNNTKLVEAIGLYTNLPVSIAKNNECLEVSRMGSKVKFTSKNIKPTIGGTFLKTLINVCIVFIVMIVIFVLLVKFV
ncbi:MAG: hypothetical protein IKO19_09905 [Candidatus Riflebacteria bacterium]|nr:hypothetical protein [Candidatus Riflebacteria bacterium]